MFARVSTFQGSPDQVAAAVGTTTPAEIQALAGFKGAYALLDKKSGKAMLITLWETEAAMQASAEVAKRIRGEVVREAGAAAPPTVEMYEVLSQP